MVGGRGRRGRTQSRGQSETIGVVLILALTLFGATVALGMGAVVLDEARTNSQEAGIENALTQFDSRSAMVALGSSPTQYVDLGSAGNGRYTVDETAGWINVTHLDYDDDGANEVVYNATLGAVTYEHDDRHIAYQGGGVWLSTGAGSRMVSPPEFHYQRATLTLLIMRVQGSSSLAGEVTARIVEDGSRRIYPNGSATYPVTSDAYQNPVRDGNITVTVKSDYYEAWAQYFRTRTTGEVTVDHDQQTVSLKLISVGTIGEFQMPADGNSIELRSLPEDHGITDFTIRIRPDNTDSADFANLQWSLYAQQGNDRFEIHLREGGVNNDPDTACTERDIAVTVYYSDTNGDPYQAWHNGSAFRTDCGDLDNDGDAESYLDVDLLGSTMLTMQSAGSSHLQHFDTGGDSLQSSVTMDDHDVDWEGPGATYADGDELELGNLTNHYLALMGPSVDLTVEDKNSNTINEDASEGQFEHTGGAGSFITFLHISENRITVEFQ